MTLAPKQRCRWSKASGSSKSFRQGNKPGHVVCHCGTEIKLYRKGYGYARYIPVHDIPRETMEEQGHRLRLEGMSCRVRTLERLYFKSEVEPLKKLVAMMMAKRYAQVTIAEWVSREESV